MTPLPNPPSPTLRIALYWSSPTGEFGSRFFVTYSGGPPSPADCIAFATSAANAWNTSWAPNTNNEIALLKVIVTDLTLPTGAVGEVDVDHGGSVGGASMPINSCQDVEFKIGRRYRGGKPRISMPPASPTQLTDDQHWSGTQVTNMNVAWAGFIAAILATTSGTTVLVAHVSLGYYSGVQAPITLPSGRVKQASKPLAVPHSDPVTSHNGRAVVGSQRRRLTSAT